MTPSLYFVSIIERALMQPDPEAALLDAFAEIEQFVVVRREHADGL